MNNQACNWCGYLGEPPVEIHGSYLCYRCRNNINPCCSGETACKPEGEEMLKANGFDTAMIGKISTFEKGITLLYSTKKILNILRIRDGMSEEEAMDFFNFNILGSSNGEGMPSFLNDHICD